MRTLQDIQAHIKEIKSSDFIGFEIADLGVYLPTPMLNEIGFDMSGDYEPNPWNETTPEKVKRTIIEYLDFAIGKAEDHRGLSAGRSIDHMRAWLWLIEDDELYQFALDNEKNYRNYGAPILLAVSKKYRPDVSSFNDGFLNMAKGLPCYPGCQEGCGRQ